MRTTAWILHIHIAKPDKMVYDALHKSIVHLDWESAEATLATDSGREMAKDKFKEDLPLHMACERRAPESTILTLLSLFRDAAAVRGRYGSLPLHIAAQRSLSPAVIVALIRAYPRALDKRNKNQYYPRSYPQKNGLIREALSRPSACWTEDVEKEEYLERVARKRTQLRQKLVKLQCDLAISKERRERTEKAIKALEPRLKNQDSALARRRALVEKVEGMEKGRRARMDQAQGRMELLSTDLYKPKSEEEVMMRSLMKRSYMQAVQKEFEAMLSDLESVRKEIHALQKVRHQQRDTPESTRDDGRTVREVDCLPYF